MAAGTILFYLEGDRAIHFKLGTSGVLYNGQFSGTLLFCGVPIIARHGRREGDEPADFGQVEQLQMRLLILPFE